MAVWKRKPGTVANEKHSISEFDGLLFCYSIWLKFFQNNLSAAKQKIIFVSLLCVNNKSIFSSKRTEKEKASKWSVSWAPDLDAFKITWFSCLPRRLFPFLDFNNCCLGCLGNHTIPSKFFWFKCYSGIFLFFVKAKLRNDASNRAGAAWWWPEQLAS